MRAAARLTELLEAISEGDAGLERLATLLQGKPLVARTLLQLADRLKALGGSERQQHAANQKHAVSKKAKAYAIKEYLKEGYRFRSKVAFARYFVGKVRTKFQIEVKHGTIARDWLGGVGNFEEPPPNAIAYAGGHYFVLKLKI